jgi:hypothetical protein
MRQRVGDGENILITQGISQGVIAQNTVRAVAGDAPTPMREVAQMKS